MIAEESKAELVLTRRLKSGAVNKISILLRTARCFAARILLPKRREGTIIKELLINGQIREREVRLLDSAGEQIGLMSSFDALRLAEEKDLDLVLISPMAKPPVCKIMDYGKYKFETVKREKENRKNQKIVELKEVWLSATIDVGDLNTKAKQAQKFLSEGNRVRVSIRLRGRQMARPELSAEVMNDFCELVKEYGTAEKKPLLEGRTMAMTLNPIVKK